MSTTPATLDLRALDGLRELNPDDPAFLRELIDLFISDVADRIAEIERALPGADLNLLVRAAHTIKGSCSNFGAHHLTQLSHQMELHGKAADLAAATALLPELRAEYTAVAEALKQVR